MDYTYYKALRFRFTNWLEKTSDLVRYRLQQHDKNVHRLESAIFTDDFIHFIDNVRWGPIKTLSPTEFQMQNISLLLHAYKKSEFDFNQELRCRTTPYVDCTLLAHTRIQDQLTPVVSGLLEWYVDAKVPSSFMLSGLYDPRAVDSLMFEIRNKRVESVEDLSEIVTRKETALRRMQRTKTSIVSSVYDDCSGYKIEYLDNGTPTRVTHYKYLGSFKFNDDERFVYGTNYRFGLTTNNAQPESLKDAVSDAI